MIRTHVKFAALAAFVYLTSFEPAISKNAVEASSGEQNYLAILTIGNSITLHAPLKPIDWNGNWGMAATEASKDYSAQVAQGLSRNDRPAPKLTRINFASFERTFWQEPNADKLTEIRTAAAKSNLIIIQLSDNVSDSDFSTYQFEKHYLTLTQEIHSASPKANIVCIGPWWKNDRKEGAVSRSCNQVGGTHIQISDLSADPRNKASSERQLNNPGVAAHPGDLGMSKIAKRIVSKVLATGKNR